MSYNFVILKWDQNLLHHFDAYFPSEITGPFHLDVDNYSTPRIQSASVHGVELKETFVTVMGKNRLGAIRNDMKSFQPKLNDMFFSFYI